MLNYQVGHGAAGAPVTLGFLRNAWLTFALMRVNVVADPSELQIVTTRWENTRTLFRGPLDLPDEAARSLVVHNLAVDSNAARGRFIVGDRILTAAEARLEVAKDTSLARPLIALGRHFAKALVDSSGIPLTARA